jgi:hypothetical protein
MRTARLSTALAVGASLVFGARAHAATITVLNTNDSGTGSLRAALASAQSGDTIVFNLSSGAQTIQFTTTDASTTATTLPAAPFGATALVVLGKSVTIDGSAVTGGLTITTGITQRLFAVTGGRTTNSGNTVDTPAGSLTLVNLTLKGGQALPGFAMHGGAGAGLGGAIYVDQGCTLNLEGCLVANCSATGGSSNLSGGGAGGGGLDTNEASPASGAGGDPNPGLLGAGPGAGGFGGGGASGTTGFAGGFGGGGGQGTGGAGGAGGFGGGGGGGTTGSALGGFGGGSGDATSDGGGGAGLGGGIFVDGGTVTVVNSTFFQCFAAGGIAGSGTATDGSGFGGAIFQRNGTVTLLFSTLAFNEVTTDGGALYALGDGGMATVTVNSSILSNSTGAATTHDFVSATNPAGVGSSSVGIGGPCDHDVVMTPSGSSLTLSGSTGDPLLQTTPTANGGPTMTLKPGSGSSAFDAGDASIEALAFPNGPAAVDQRGFPRRIGFCDAGALERQPLFLSLLNSVQSAKCGQAFALPIVFQVGDLLGNFLKGVIVTVTITPASNGATGTVVPAAPYVTDANGKVSLTATANTIAGGPYTVTENVVSGTSPFGLSALLTNLPGPPAAITVQEGDGQSTPAGIAFTNDLVVFVQDQFGNPVDGLSFVFTPPASGPSANFGTVTGLGAGRYSIPMTANTTAGVPYTVKVTSGAASATLGLTNTGPATTITVVSGGNQSVVTGSLATAPVVLSVVDAFLNPIPNLWLAFFTPSSGASATIPAAVTNSTGQASAMATANGTTGSYTVHVLPAVGGATVSFSLKNVSPSSSGGGGGSSSGGGGGTQTTTPSGPGAPASIAVVSGAGPTNVATGLQGPIVLQVNDASGTPVPGVLVTFTAPSSGPSATLSPASATTDSSGRVSFTPIPNKVAGNYTVTATVSGISTSVALSNPAPFSDTTVSGGGGGGGHSSSGCTVGSGQGSPASLAPLALALVALVARRKRARAG